MERTQVFTCTPNKFAMNKILRKNDRLFLKIDGSQITGTGHIFNSDGRNGYIGDFELSIKDIEDVKEEDFEGVQAFTVVYTEKTLYGAKKNKIIFPQLIDADMAIAMLNKLKKGAGETEKPKKETVVPVKTVEPPKKEEQAEEVKATETPKSSDNGEKDKTENKEQAKGQENKAEAQAPKNSSEKSEISEAEFQNRMDKLAVLVECGMLDEKEYVTKKLELVSEFCDLTEFNEKLQKLIALKDCGLLSDKEFDANRIDVIKECCDLDVSDINEYRRNVQKLSFLEIGGIITPEEYDKSKQSLVQDVRFFVSDTDDNFVRKLQRLPVLKEGHLISEEEYDKKVKELFTVVEILEDDYKEKIICKLKKWPLLAQEGYIEPEYLEKMQNELISDYLDSDWQTPSELEDYVGKMTLLKEGLCINEQQFAERREKMLTCVDVVPEYKTRVAMYKLLHQVSFVDDEEYAKMKQKCIDEIFYQSTSVEEFKVRANNLVELNKVGMLSDEEYTSYKMQMMNEL